MESDIPGKHQKHSPEHLFPFRPKRRTPSIYQPLGNPEESIRVLELYPGTLNDALVCKLANSTIHNARGVYQAISYTWGDPNTDVTITCNGQRVTIRKNAFLALRALRSNTTKKFIWIDSLCINQSDPEERGHQVSIMRNIFEAAREVIIWLGPDNEDFTLAINYILTLDPEENDPRFANRYSSIPSTFDKSFSNATEELKRSVHRLLSLEWFSRVWVQQEAIACSDTSILLAESSIPLDQFLVLIWQYIKFIVDRPGDSARMGIPSSLLACYNMQKHRFAREMNAEPMSFLRVLGTCSGLMASDPRDKIYALIQLGQGRNLSDWALAPKPDYTASPDKVFVDLAMIYLTSLNFEIIDFVCRRYPSSSRDIVLPSWCPDWLDNCWDFACWPENCAAGGDSNPTVKFANVGTPGSTVWITTILMKDTLSFLDGLDTLSFSVRKHKPPSGSDFAKAREIEMACYGAATQYPYYFTGETSVVAYVAFMLDSFLPLERLITSFHEYQELQKWLHDECRAMDSSMPTKAENFAINLTRFFYGMKFCITTHGLMGAVPETTSQTDLVCILKGYKYGVVLRPRGTQYQLLGRCWMHGIMDGEISTLLEQRQVSKDSSPHLRHLPDVGQPGQDGRPLQQPDYSGLLDIVAEEEIDIV